MGKQGRERFNWRRILGILALSLGTAGAMEARAVAAPEAAEDIYLAQVGVRSRINSPTPLNLRPRTHIPLPQSSSYNRRYRNYPHNYGYGDSYRQRQSHRRYRDYDRREDKYGDQYRQDRYEHRHRRQRPGGSITIYF